MSDNLEEIIPGKWNDLSSKVRFDLLKESVNDVIKAISNKEPLGYLFLSWYSDSGKKDVIVRINGWLNSEYIKKILESYEENQV